MAIGCLDSAFVTKLATFSSSKDVNYTGMDRPHKTFLFAFPENSYEKASPELLGAGTYIVLCKQLKP